jgi:hypothetical protein
MGRPWNGPRGYGGNNGKGNRGYQIGIGNGGNRWNGGNRGNGRYQGNNNNGGQNGGKNNNQKINKNSSNNNNNRQRDGWQQRWGYTLYSLIVSGIESEKSAELKQVVSAAALALSSAVNRLQGEGKKKSEIARELNIPWQACQRLHHMTGFLMEGFLEPGPDKDGDTPMSENDCNSGGVIYADIDNTDLEKLLFDAIVGYIQHQ